MKMVRYGSLVEGKLSASLLSPFLCISGRRRDQENDDKGINGDGGNENDETYLVRKGMLMMMPVMRPPMTETASEIPRTVIWIPAWFFP